MPKFSKRSADRLATCDASIQRVMNEAIKHFDFTVLYGHRTVAEQQELYAQGRTKPGKKVTNLDGVNKKSKHNYSPSKAVDIAPYPIDWNNIARFEEMATVVKAAAKAIGVEITWGGDWKSMKDYPHFEIA